MCDIQVHCIKSLVLAQHIAYNEYIQLYRMSKTEEDCLPFPRPVTTRHFLLLLTILPAGSDLPSIPPTG